MIRTERIQLLRLAAALRDFNFARSAAAQLSRAKDDELRHHLFTSFVVAYTRPFTSNKGIGSLYENYPEYRPPHNRIPDPDLRARHGRLWRIRNSFVAHGEISGLKLILVPPNVPSPISGRRMAHADFAIGTRAFLHPSFTSWLADAVEPISKRVNHDLQLLLRTHSKGDTIIELETGADYFRWD